jgi:hypothetical protein
VAIVSALTGPKYNPSPGNSGQERSNAVRPLLSVAARRIAAYKRHQRVSQEKAQTSMLVVRSTTLNNAAKSKVPH